MISDILARHRRSVLSGGPLILSTRGGMSKQSLDRFAKTAISQFAESPYFGRAEAHTKRQWSSYIEPVLKGADMRCVLDLACGHGRFSELLAPLSERLIVADANESCIAATRERLSNFSHVDYIVTNGYSLDEIPDATITFIFCFDAMVHFDNDVVSAYIEEAERVLVPGGIGFFHHSNFMERPGADHRSNPHARNFMSTELFAHQAKKFGLKMLRSTKISWGSGDRFVPYLDGISVVQKPGGEANKSAGSNA
jgi:SAM-dependent methyltransferase